MAAPNSFDVSDFLAREVLRKVTNKLVITESFDTSYNKMFTQAYTAGPMGDTVRVPYPRQMVPGTNNNLGYEPQALIDRSTSVTIDQIAKVHFEYDVIERALRMRDYEGALTEDVIEPAANTMAQDIEDRAALYAYQHTPNIVGILGTNPTTFDAVFGAALERLTELGTTAGQRVMILWPSVTRALTAAALPLFQPLDAVSRAFKEGAIGRVQSFDTYSSPSLYSHTAGTWAGTVEILTAPTAPADAGTGITSLSLTATTGDTFLKGDVFNIAAVNEVNLMTRRSTGRLRQFSVQAAVTAAASAATVTITPPMYGPGSPYQNVDALPLAGADLTLFPGTTSPNGKIGRQSLALGKQAFGLVGVKLKVPPSGGDIKTAQRRDPTSGLAVVYTQQFTNDEMKYRCRFDCAFGFAEFWNSNSAIRVLGAA
jgi:coat protein Gp5